MTSHGVRQTLVGLVTRAFEVLPLPASFPARCSSGLMPIFVTRGSSIVHEGVLRALCTKAEIKNVFRIENTTTPLSTDPSTVLWVSMRDEELLLSVIKENPNREFVTVNIFCGRGPVKNNPAGEGGFFQSLVMLLGRRALIVRFGDTTARDREGRGSEQRTIRELKLEFYRTLKLVRGTPFQSIDTQAQAVLAGAEFERDLSVVAESLNISINTARRRARKSFYEMAANPWKPMYFPLALACRIITGKLFTSIQTTGLDRFAETARENTVVLVPIHRSHLDYIILGHRLYESKLNPPLVAAGVNLSFWPIGFVLRSVGAFFVKREARSDRFHGVVLKRYVTYLIKRGHLQEFFIEGGRSRSGKMRQPKLGLLRVFAEAYLKKLRKDILFVPVSITYEAVVEDKVYGQENTGQKKEKESLRGLLRARELFSKKYGEVSVKFGEPLSIASFAGAMTSEAKGSDIRALVSNLGNVITQKIRTQSSVSLSGLAYTALMMAPRYGLPRDDLSKTIRNLARVVTVLREVSPETGDLMGSLQSFLSGKEQILNDLSRGGVITAAQCLGKEVFFIPGNKRFTGDFYKNSVVHLFFISGILSMLDCAGYDISPANAMRFYDVFEDDFLLSERTAFEREVSETINVFKKQGILGDSNGRLGYTKRDSGVYLPSLLLASVQSTLWVYYNLESAPSTPTAGSEGEPQTRWVEYGDFMKRLQTEFRAAGYLTIMSRTEASSQSNLLSVVESLSQRQRISIQDRPREGKRIVFGVLPNEEIKMLQEVNSAVMGWLASHAGGATLFESDKALSL